MHRSIRTIILNEILIGPERLSGIQPYTPGILTILPANHLSEDSFNQNLIEESGIILEPVDRKEAAC